MASIQTLAGLAQQLYLRSAVALQARSSGWLRVQCGPVWLTRDGDTTDPVLAAGEGLHLGAGERVVVEPWVAGQAAELAWGVGDSLAAPRLLPPPQRLAGAFLRGVAGFRRAAADLLAAAARSADAMAKRAQGSIAAGDSIASSGALQ